MKKIQTGRTCGDETAPLINCFMCKHCLPPIMRENGRMCKLDECMPEMA